MKLLLIGSLWTKYKAYSCAAILQSGKETSRDMSYWRNTLFCNILTYMAPISVVALIPGVYMAFKNGIPIVGVADLLSFGGILILVLNRRLAINVRKFIFIAIIYGLSIVLLLSLPQAEPGVLFLLTLTILTCIIYSPSGTFYSAWINTGICIAIGVCIYLEIHIPIVDRYTLGAWIAISSNLVLLSFVCNKSLNVLLGGLESYMAEKLSSEANLTAIIENSEASIYSLDVNLNYITFNQKLKRNLKQAYNLDTKTGDNVLQFLEESSLVDAREWRHIYKEALGGKPIRFEKDFSVGSYKSTIDFSVHPIIENKKVIGLSCFALDITEEKRAELERERIGRDLIQRNTDLQQFAYIVSHNLRAPVATILSVANVLKEDSSDEERQEFLPHLFTAVGRLDNIVVELNTILAVRVQNIETKEPVYFQTLVENIQSSLQHFIEEEDVHILTDFSEIDHIVSIESYIHSIFYNLITNSIKFRRPGITTVIWIRSKLKSGKITLLFSDNGRGIDLALNKDKLFGLYKRFHLDVEGKGIGLYMVKTQVDVLGGTIVVNSEPHVGTEFIVEFEN